MKKIIHFSDLHIGYNDNSKRFEDIITNMIFTKEPAGDYVVVITGDIVEDATREGVYQEAYKHIVRMKDAGFHVLVCPGNHDYGTGHVMNRKYISLFKKQFFGTEEITYPKLDMIDNVACMGLDSMAEELNFYDRFLAHGELGYLQLARLSKMLASKEVFYSKFKVVYLHHHPFNPKLGKQLKDSDKFKEVLRKHKIDALLFGHNHAGKIWHGKCGIKRVYDAGTSTGKDGYPNPHRVINLSSMPQFDYDAKF